MSRLTILIPVKIVTEGKYCDALCPQLIAYKPCCLAFEKQLDTCLGGGPLRCAACIEAERNPVVSPISGGYRPTDGPDKAPERVPEGGTACSSKQQEFTLYPVGFATQEEFSKAVNEIWSKGHRARVVLSQGEREP